MFINNLNKKHYLFKIPKIRIVKLYIKIHWILDHNKIIIKINNPFKMIHKKLKYKYKKLKINKRKNNLNKIHKK
jgi:hypothetical protein